MGQLAWLPVSESVLCGPSATRTKDEVRLLRRLSSQKLDQW